MDINEQMLRNQKNWNERVPIHMQPDADFYDMDGFLNGQCTLKQIEKELAGNVRGKDLLHMMCHFGLDTLSWARLGANVTGVDFSKKAIEEAKVLAKRSGLNAAFVCSNIYDIRKHIKRKFDIVVATYGILCWLPSIQDFCTIASDCLKENGIFILVDGHPFFDMVEHDNGTLLIKYSYFHNDEPDVCESKTSYTGSKDSSIRNKITYQWSHDIGSIFTAIRQSKMEIVSFGEYPFGFYKKHSNMVCNRGKWELPESYPKAPILMSIKARKMK